MATQKPPRTKSVKRFADSAVKADEKERKKSSRDSFVNFQNNLGIGTDNPMTSSTYGFNPITRQRTLLEWIHRGSWLGGVVVDSVADDMTRAGIDIVGGTDPESIERMEEVATEYGVWNTLNETIKWARLYGGSLAFMMIDGQDPSTPFRLNTIRKGQFRGLLSLDRWMVEPTLSDLVTDMGPSIGLPKFYNVTSNAPALSRMKIHYSRVIRLEGIRLPYWQRVQENLWGLSVLERLYDRMIAFDSATTGAAQLVYKSFLRTYKVKDLREIVSAGGDALNGLTAYVDMIRRFQGIEGITLLDSEDEFEGTSHSAFGGLSDALAQFSQQLSGATGIPLVRLFGQSPMGFSTGETDLRNYYDMVKQQQEKELKTGVTTVYRVIAASEGLTFAEGTSIKFRSLWQLDDEAKANIANTLSSAITNAETQSIIDKPTAMRELRQVGQITGVFTNVTDKQIKEAELEGPPPAEIPEGEDPSTPTGGAKGAPGGKGGDSAQNAPAARKRAQDVAPVAAGVLVVTEDGKVLLIKRGPDGDYPGTWAVPGGHIEPGESPIDAAIREFREETGVELAGVEPSPLNISKTGFVGFRAVVRGEFNVKLNEESTDHMWVNPLEAARMGLNLHPGTPVLLLKAI